MAAEKVCKAHLSLQGYEQVRKVHGYTTGTLPVIARVYLAEHGANNPNSSWQLLAIKAFAHEIDVLAPASHDNLVRQDNCEYPWEDASGAIILPCEYTFPNLPNGRNLILILRILRTSAERYASSTY